MFPGELATARPFLMFLFGLAADYAVSRGWLTPEQKDTWINGALAIVGGVGTVILTSIALWHEYVRSHNQQQSQLNVNLKTVTTPPVSPLTKQVRVQDVI